MKRVASEPKKKRKRQKVAWLLGAASIFVIYDYLFSGVFGFLFAGPFEFVVETNDNLAEVAVHLDNVKASVGYEFNPGGAYEFTEFGASNSVIKFPRFFLYDWTFAGGDALNGYVSHPYLVPVSVTLNGVENNHVEVNLFDLVDFQNHTLVEGNKPLRIHLKMKNLLEAVEGACSKKRARLSEQLLSVTVAEVPHPQRCHAMKAATWFENSIDPRYFRSFTSTESLQNALGVFMPFYEKYDEQYYDYQDLRDRASAFDYYRNYRYRITHPYLLRVVSEKH